MATRTSIHPLPTIYWLFFLYIEPLATLAGAYYAALRPSEYLTLTVPGSGSLPNTNPLTPNREIITLLQLANMYLVFAFTEACVLRASSDMNVWRALLLGLLIADLGHMWSVNSMGWSVYWRFWEWNEIYWGNLGFVYVGAAMRVSFLSGLGYRGGGGSKARGGGGRAKRAA